MLSNECHIASSAELLDQPDAHQHREIVVAVLKSNAHENGAKVCCMTSPVHTLRGLAEGHRVILIWHVGEL